ncbi:MAG: hypothetical protein ACI9WU_000032 [Myxococcota bacterium]|jgi:hypothetical protein
MARLAEVGEVIHIGRKRVFDLSNARRTLAVVRRITERSIKEVEAVRRRHSGVRVRQSIDAFETELNTVLDDWSHKVEQLGCQPKGLWLVDFDNGEGYYCWRYPERDISHCHGYDDGYASRERF